MSAGPGYFDPEGVRKYGEADAEGLFSDLLNLGLTSVSAQLVLDRARLNALEGLLIPHTELRRRIIAATNTFTNTNAVYADVPVAPDKAALDMSFVKAKAASKLIVRVEAQLELTSGAAGGYLQIAVNVAGTDYEVAVVYPQTSTTRFRFSGMAAVTGISAGVKAIKPRVRYFNGGASVVTLFAAASDFIMYSVEETM